jgi:tRNA threonylcarbamoyladenosine biosynthesis protein TsaE
VAFTSSSAEETKRLGARLARALPEGAVVALTGELGSGKTTLVQGAAEGLGVEPRSDERAETEGVTSPTFVLVREHAGRDGRTLLHVDAHRLRGPEELRDLGADDFLGRRGVAFVEWAGRVREELPEPHLAVRLVHVAESTRRIEFEGRGAGAEALLAAAHGAVAGEE